MKTIVTRLMIVTIAMIVFTGCAKQLLIKDANMLPPATVKTSTVASQASRIDMLIEPYQSVGLKETEAINNGNCTVIGGTFPELLFGEFFPGRVRWNAWVVDLDGREYFAQALFSGLDFSGLFRETIVIDEKPGPEAKILVLSTLVNYAYDLAGNETEISQKKFLEDREYRKKIAFEKGTKLGEMKKIPDFLKTVQKWNRYETPNRTLRSPLGEKEIGLISGINPKYSFSEKLVGSGKFAISADWISTAAGIAIDILQANGVPSTGWDYNSEIPSRRNMAFIIKYVSEMKQRLVENINRANMELMQSRR